EAAGTAPARRVGRGRARGDASMSSAPMAAKAGLSGVVAEQGEAPAAAEPNTPHRPPRRVGRWVLAIGTVMVILLVVALIGGTLPKLRREREVNAAAADVAAAPPRLPVAIVKRMVPEAERVL